MSQDELESAAPPAGGLLTALRAQASTGDLVVYGIVVVLMLLALLAQPLWGLAQPGLALGHDYLERAPKHDPWGRPWHEEAQADVSYAPLRVWSAGPNGVDERGQGDDVVLSFGLAATLYGGASEWVVLVAGLLVGLWELRRILRSQLRKPRSPTPGPEVLRAAGLGIPLGLVLAVVAVALWRLGEARAPETAQILTETLWVPPWVAAAGCAYLASTGFFLCVRLSRAPATADV